MLDGKSYYDVALADFKFLEFYYSHIDEAPSYNAILVQEQQVAEKLLKFILDVYIDIPEAVDLLKSHKLANILRGIRKSMDCPLNADDLRFLSDFYFDGRYPSKDYVFAEKNEAIKGFHIVKDVLNWVDSVKNLEPIKKINAF